MPYALKALFFAILLVSSGSIVPFTFAQNATLIPPPLKQIKDIIPSYDIRCNQGFALVIKTSNSFPACVKPETAKKLVERGWGILKEQLVLFEHDDIYCQSNPWDQGQDNFARIPYLRAVMGPYFHEHGITIIDARLSVHLFGGIPPACGTKSGVIFYFLVTESDANKMIKLGFNKVTYTSLVGTLPVK